MAKHRSRKQIQNRLLVLQAGIKPDTYAGFGIAMSSVLTAVMGAVTGFPVGLAGNGFWRRDAAMISSLGIAGATAMAVAGFLGVCMINKHRYDQQVAKEKMRAIKRGRKFDDLITSLSDLDGIDSDSDNDENNNNLNFNRYDDIYDL